MGNKSKVSVKCESYVAKARVERRTFSGHGRVERGYDVMTKYVAIGEGGKAAHSTVHTGFIVKREHDGRLAGWIILHPRTGETLFGLGQATHVGLARNDALWAWDRKLEREAEA